MNKRSIHLVALSLVMIMIFVAVLPYNVSAQSQSDVPAVNINKAPDTAGQPWGGFKLTACDGPDLKGLTQSITIDFNGQKIATVPGSNPAGYVPCDFNGLRIQIQYLINLMLGVGVVAALGGFTYAGYLYIGTPIADNKNKAKEIFRKILIGFIVMITAWFIVQQILIWLTGTSAYLK